MCEDKDCECHSKRKHHGHHHRYHWGYRSIVKRDSKDVLIPEVLLEVADIEEGNFLEISIRKIKKHHDERY